MGYYNQHYKTIEVDGGSGLSGRVSCITAMIIFGTIGIFVRYIPLPSSFLALVRAVLGTVFIFFVMLIKGDRISWKAVKKNLFVLIPSGIALGANWILLFEAYRYTTVATATLCYYMAPTIIILVSPIVLSESLNLKKIFCVLLSFTGMVLVSGVIQTRSFAELNLTGVFYGLAAAVLYAAVVILNKKINGLGGFERTMIQLAISAIVLIPYNLLTGAMKGITLDRRALILLLVVGVVHTGIAYTLYFGSIGKLPAQSAALFSYIDPVLALILSVVVLKENMDIKGIIGAVLILGAALLGELKGKRKDTIDLGGY